MIHFDEDRANWLEDQKRETALAPEWAKPNHMLVPQFKSQHQFHPGPYPEYDYDEMTRNAGRN